MNDSATAIRAMLDRASRLDEKGVLMDRPVCPARHKDRWLSIHECSLDPDHGGYHRTVDGLMFHDEEAVRLRRVPIRAEQYRGETAIIRELAEVVGTGDFDAIVVRIAKRITSLFNGDWLVQYDDGRVERWEGDRFAEQFELVRS